MDTSVKFTDSKLHKCESYIVNKLKAHPHSKGHPANTVSKKVSFDLIFPITFIGYNGLKGYISQTNYKSHDIEIKLIKSKDKTVDYII